MKRQTEQPEICELWENNAHTLFMDEGNSAEGKTNPEVSACNVLYVNIYKATITVFARQMT